MDEALLKSGTWPNVAVPAGSDAAAVMAAHGVGSGEKPTLADLFGIWKDDDGRDVDSREKLEADVKETIDFWGAAYPDARVRMVLSWLDRQAAIAEEKTRYKWVTASAEEIAAWRSKAEKLKEQVYELTAERDRLREAIDAFEAGTMYEAYRKMYYENVYLQKVVRTQADSFAKLEREIADLKADNARRGQLQPEAQNSALDGLRTCAEHDLRTAAYRHEHLIRAMWRDMDVWRLRGHLPDDLVDGWRERLENEGVSVE